MADNSLELFSYILKLKFIIADALMAVIVKRVKIKNCLRTLNRQDFDRKVIVDSGLVSTLKQIIEMDKDTEILNLAKELAEKWHIFYDDWESTILDPKVDDQKVREEKNKELHMFLSKIDVEKGEITNDKRHDIKEFIQKLYEQECDLTTVMDTRLTTSLMKIVEKVNNREIAKIAKSLVIKWQVHMASWEKELVTPKLFYLGKRQVPLKKGAVIVCGQGGFGQLGLGKYKLVCKQPGLLLGKIGRAVDIAAGGIHSLVLNSEGKVYSFGCNDDGALGRASNKEGLEYEPGLVDFPEQVVMVTAGDAHSACLLISGEVFAWGTFRCTHSNKKIGEKPHSVIPQDLCYSIASGSDHLVMLSRHGEVYTVGASEEGQLGMIPKPANKTGGKYYAEKIEFTCKRRISKIWATKSCTFMQSASDPQKIYVCGFNNYRQLLVNTEVNINFIPREIELSDVKDIVGGQHHTIVLKNDGSCHVIGRADYGRLGLGYITKDQVKLRYMWALAKEKIVGVAAGDAQSFAWTKFGRLYAWGMGSNNQLGLYSGKDVHLPQLLESRLIKDYGAIKVSCGGQHTLFLLEETLD